MNKLSALKRISLGSAVFAFTIGMAVSVLPSTVSAHKSAVAEHENEHEKIEKAERSEKVEQREVVATEHMAQSEERQMQITERKAAAKAKLTDAKLKACQNREARINTILTKQSERATKHLVLFTTIAKRVQAFYSERELTLTNYDELVANVEARKAAAETAVSNMQSPEIAFSCESDDPKAFIQVFVSERKLAIDALREYRTTVKDLIVGVKSVVGSTTSAANKVEETE